MNVNVYSVSIELHLNEDCEAFCLRSIAEKLSAFLLQKSTVLFTVTIPQKYAITSFADDIADILYSTLFLVFALSV